MPKSQLTIPFRLFFAIILMLATIAQVCGDLYLPSLPAIASEFATDIDWAQFSLAAYMFSFSFSQLVYGPLSDGIGRKKPLLVGLTLLLLGSLICSTAISMTWFIIGRFVQGLGAGSGISLARAMMRDVFDTKRLAQIASYLSFCFIYIVISAPFVGGHIQHWLGWRANFEFLCAYILLCFSCVLFILPETNRYLHRDHLKVRGILSNIKILLKNSVFIFLCAISFLCYGSVLIWLTVNPVLLQQKFGFTPISVGTVSLVVGSFNGFATLLNGRLVAKQGVYRMVSIGLSIMLISGLVMLALGLMHVMQAWAVLVPMCLFFLGTGLVFSNVSISALSIFPKIAGISSSFYGFVQTVSGALASSLIAHVHDRTQMPLAIALTTSSLLSLLLLLSLMYSLRHQPNQLEQ